VTEALTNATKHAGASYAHVTVEQHDALLHLPSGTTHRRRRSHGRIWPDAARSRLARLFRRLSLCTPDAPVNFAPGDAEARTHEGPAGRGVPLPVETSARILRTATDLGVPT
jgi:hypothetical protein